MNRQIGVGDSKNGIVLDPLLTGHVIRRMRSGRVRIHKSRTDRRRVFKLGGRVVHVTRHVWQLLRVKNHRSRSQGHAQEIYAIKGFSKGDARE